MIQPFAAGAVTGVFETLDAVTAGVLQAQASWPGYWTGKDAGLAVISDFVFGYQHPWQAEAWFYHRGGLQMLRQAYAKYNVYPVGVSWWGVESIVSKKQIARMEDFKGVKFRSPQGMTAEILTKLGASIVVLPGGEVYSALDKGVVDAADWATRVDEPAHGLPRHRQVPDQAVPLDADPGVHRQHGRLEEAARRPQGAARHRGARMDLGPDPAHRRRRPPRGRRSSRPRASSRRAWPEAEMVKIRALAQRTWEEWSKKTPLAKQAYDSQLAWLKDLGVVA